MSKRVEIWRGEPYPLGATLTEEGVNFALYSEDATAVELCLFDSPESDASELRIPVTEKTDQTWHVFLPDIGPGQLYCYRVQGIYEPAHGLRFNNTKLLLDPYAQAIAGQVNWGEEVFAYTLGHPAGSLAVDYRDDAFCVPKCVVVDPNFDWVGDVASPTPLHASVIYELHVKGFSMLNLAVPPPLRGTYAGLGCEPAIDYLKSLGVTAVELLPVHQHIDDMHLVRSGKTNYWGYNSIGFFAPECSYSSSGVIGGQVTEFKQMVKKLHRAGIEVILDVVYNHSAEGDHLGPTFCFKGIDNVHYYRLAPWDQGFYMDYTGCGNTLDATKPRVLQMITDSLRYWITEMHVDGFRFDLAASLARGEFGVSKFAAFFESLHQDPVISRVKLIAEPWDVGEGGYQVGNFPVLWAEWNGRYRDSVRRFWKGDTGLVGEIAYRLSGSSDLYQSTGKRPYASINFVTSHDGFTLNDLVSYNAKHNEANGEGNRDGDDNNNSRNCGVEGSTADEGINALRDRQRRNFLATLLLSQGVPMLCAGDEFCRTQGGNNNAYCQDNPVSWLSWEHDARAKSLLDFTRTLIAQRRAHPIFRRPKFFQGRPIRGATIKDIMWFNSSGAEMSDAEWSSWFIRCLGMLLGGATIDVRDRRGRPLRDDTFLVLLNAHYEPVPFVLPSLREAEWELMMDTAREPSFVAVGETYGSAACYDLRDRSTALLRLKAGFEPDAVASKRDESLNSQLRSEQRIAATATRKLESSRERLSILAATTADGIWDYDYDSGVNWWSDRVFRLLGYEPCEFEISLERVDSMVHQEDRKRRQEAIAAHLAGDTEHYFCEFRFRHKDGSYRWFLSQGSALRGENSRGIRMIGTLTDVTELKTIEADLKAAKEAADIANRAKDEFLATLSHELRTPLNAVLGWTQMIRMTERESLQNDRVREGIGVIERNVQSQLRLIEDLLDVSRIVTGKMRLDFQLIDFREVVQEAVKPLLPTAEAKDIRIEQFLDPNCGLVNGDQERLQQIIWNLLSNAIKFSKRHSKIQMTMRQANSRVELEVTDFGKGIAPELLPHLFERFVQGETDSARSVAGLGLGLAIVRHLVELHGGNVEAYSDGIGRGATFKVSLPVSFREADTN